MQTSLRFLATSMLFLTLVGIASAGPNEDGVIILHASPYQGRVTNPDPCTEPFGLTRCEDARVVVPRFEWNVWFVLAAFPDGSSPASAESGSESTTTPAL